ncbi:UDP-N-acetylglucosamine 2-epimerase (non-hydrolyzing) [Luteimonas padinae]|uniref:Non-hydrolyzing UDP-N-acetylglucosamine 2-epimerase n=1 Tax=Luteimonas padinae TaxID=1714359 RepID=A0ABV6SX59_9GAMM|nr:UDP-N-acetylglucosamine 2-epimerase (non-hydrolyzing) [Luteimonas padinae]GHD71447.1 UDP-N-acetylglucosamine 2-epimerase (non-hydrolyzing) [Luteimonas padinae]
MAETGSHRACRLDLIAGTRPNLVKLAPLRAELSASPWCDPDVVFLEQHTAGALSSDVMADLGIDPRRIHRIPLGEGGSGQRLGDMITRYGEHVMVREPDLVIVFGDVDATLAATIAAKRNGYPVAHVEAGLRSRDRRMPEELNRLMVDAIADMFFTTTAEASSTLQSEGQDPARIHLVGNLMIDSLHRGLDLPAGRRHAEALGLTPGEFIVATFHRPSNVDDRQSLENVLDVLGQAAERLPVLLPRHPRTAAALERHGLGDRIGAIPGLHLTSPIRYREFISLVAAARLVITDSGGIQEETTVLGIPCLTFRENTERPETITHGTNRLVDIANAGRYLDEAIQAPPAPRPEIPLWDGRCAQRIAAVLEAWWAR